MCLVSHRYRFIFVKEAHVAGTSVEAYLSRLCCDEDYARNTDLLALTAREHVSSAGVIGSRNHSPDNPKGRWHNHIGLERIRELFNDDEAFDEYLTITIVRNPWNKTFSRYIRGNRKCTLREYIDSAARKSARSTIRRLSLDGRFAIDYAIRFENLMDDIRVLRRALGVKESLGELPRHRTDKIKQPEKRAMLANYRDYYSTDTRQAVQSIYQPYIDEFNYEF